MKLIFLGTRGYIEPRTRPHFMHSAMMVVHRGKQVMVDCGSDWLGRFEELGPDAIVVTHAHPDHAWGLKSGAPCPVYATEEAWETMDGFDIKERRVIGPRRPSEVEGFVFEAFEVEHSIRAPAVGFRISEGGAALFYAPDVVHIKERNEALSGIELYIGDGATLTRSMVRKAGSALIGHAPVSTQLTWCSKERVRRALFTHCGPAIVEEEEEDVRAEVIELGRKRGVEADIARDGMEVLLG